MAPPYKRFFTEVLHSDLLLRGAGGAAFLLHNAETWRPHHYAMWGAVVLGGMEILSSLVFVFGRLIHPPPIPPKGKHLDKLEHLDLAFITFNKLVTCLFTYHLLRFLWLSPEDMVLWSTSKLAATREALSMVTLYVVYDFFYTLFHRALHHRSIYKYIHKHHHRQKAPSRGNTDAVNVHPFEFVSGEYNHLFTLYLVSRFLFPVHVITAMVFIMLGGFLASLNHTRFDLVCPIFPGVYQVKFHDIHHWFPECNYGQYIMLWDHVFGSFKPYPTEAKAS